MTQIEAIRARHSVRRYSPERLPDETLSALRDEIEKVNAEGHLHVQLVIDEPKAFSGLMAYGSFSGVRNYLVMAGKKTSDLDERIGCGIAGWRDIEIAPLFKEASALDNVTLPEEFWNALGL